MIADNPLAEVRLPKPIRDRHPAVEFSEVNKILAALPAHTAAAIATLAFAGLRAGEMQRLQTKNDIDLRRGWIAVCSRDGLETKTRQSRRIPIHPRLKSYLKQIAPSSGPWLFTDPGTDGAPINIRKLNAEFQAVAKQFGMNVGRKQLGYTLHSLRHFFETFCVNARIPQRVVDQWMGHTGDRSMAAMYYQLSPDESQRFMNEVPFGADSEAA
jgi:integrase